MKTRIAIVVFAFASILAFGANAFAAGEVPPIPPKAMENAVEGKLMKIDGDSFVIKDDNTGKDFRVQVDKNTTKLDRDGSPMSRDFRIGDAVAARVEPSGHAFSIQMATAHPRLKGQDLSRLKKENERENLAERQRLEPKPHEGTSPYPPDFKAEVGGEKNEGPGDFPKPDFPLVKGELVQASGGTYVIQDIEGKQVTLNVDKNTKMDCGADVNGPCMFSVGDKIAAQRNSPTDPYATAIRKLSSSEVQDLSKAISPVGPSSSVAQDERVTLGGAMQSVSGEVVKADGQNYVIKDHEGSEIPVVINQNTRMWCGKTGSMSDLLPEPSAKGQSAQREDCVFKAGDKVEAEISDMGAATFIKLAERGETSPPHP